jgi:hypothetical protein
MLSSTPLVSDFFNSLIGASLGNYRGWIVLLFRADGRGLCEHFNTFGSMAMRIPETAFLRTT